MYIQFNNIFKVDHEFICFTTNGYTTKKLGHAVCGRGIALAVSLSLTDTKEKLGKLILANGNRVQLVHRNFISFPVKPIDKIIDSTSEVVSHARHFYKPGDKVPGYHMKANIKIIKRSCHELVALCDKEGWGDVAIPRPGCGAGELSWPDVYKAISPILDNRFYVYTIRPNPKVCFISGSRTITKLTKEMEDTLLKIMLLDIQVIVGDCYGVDALVTDFYRTRGYTPVTVYHVKKARVTNGFKRVLIPGSSFVAKDRAMAERCNFGLILWDGKSKGSGNNIKYLTKLNKPFKEIRVS